MFLLSGVVAFLLFCCYGRAVTGFALVTPTDRCECVTHVIRIRMEETAFGMFMFKCSTQVKSNCLQREIGKVTRGNTLECVCL